MFLLGLLKRILSSIGCDSHSNIAAKSGVHQTSQSGSEYYILLLIGGKL